MFAPLLLGVFLVCEEIIFSFLFVLIFSTNISLADDISDFQIEGMSVGDSALNYFSEELIERNKRNYFKK